MFESALHARLRAGGDKCLRKGAFPAQGARLLLSQAGPAVGKGTHYSCVRLGDCTRVALTITPRGRGAFREQLQEVLSLLKPLLDHQPHPMSITAQTVFLRDARDQAECEHILAAYFGAKLPVINFVLQPPCCGAGLALESWAIGGLSVRVEHPGPQTLVVSHNGVRWIYCTDVKAAQPVGGVYAQTLHTLSRTHRLLERAGSRFEHVVRTWFYLGGITAPESATSRYQELNRARADFYARIEFQRRLGKATRPSNLYPASTGIGTADRGLIMSCLALETSREDVCLRALENPNQTPAYAYDRKYSGQSPKFSRAVALVLGDYVTTWISGTASIVGSESRHPGDLEKQTEQTIDNIEQLITRENFAAHGLNGAGASLNDLAKIRVYLKRPQDLAQCKEICEKRFGPVPAIYAVADICRPELLVEIEGVAFSRNAPRRAEASASAPSMANRTTSRTH